MSEIKSLARGLRVLDLIADADGDPGATGISVTEIADALGVNKSSASRLVKTLVSGGYLQRAPGSRGYGLGPKLQRFAGSPLHASIRDLARPFLLMLMKQSGECAHTAVYARGHALVIDDVEATSPLRVAGGIGRLNGLHCTAVGKCLLAFSNVAVPADLPARTLHTITDPERLARHLEETRRDGYAFDDEENEEGVRCLAAPVYGPDGRSPACIGISGPTVRMTRERVPTLAALVLDASLDLSQALGHSGLGRSSRLPLADTG